MTLRNVAGLYLVRLRGRLGQELLALVGIAAGVALLFAALVANTSLGGAFDRLTAGVVGDAQYQLAARGSTTLDERLLADVQRLPGVERAAATLETRGEARGPGGRRSVNVLGVTPEFGQLGGTFTRGFSYDFLKQVRLIAVPAPLAEQLDLSLWQPVPLVLADRVVEARLGAKLSDADIGAAVNSPFVVAPLAYAQRLTGLRQRVTRVLVVPRPGESAVVLRGLRRLAGAAHADVLPAMSDAAVFAETTRPTNQSTAMFSVFGAIVGFLFAFSAMLLTVPQRRRLIEDLDVEGYGTGTIVKVLLFDAVVLGVCASLVGIAVGDVVAQTLFDEAPAFLEFAFTIASGRVVTAWSVMIAVAGGIAASIIAVLSPVASLLWARDRARRQLWPARRRAATVAEVVTGSICLAGGIAIAVAASASAVIGIAGLVLLTAAMLLLAPTLLTLLVDTVDFATRGIRSVVPFLAIFDLRDPAARARTIAVAATGAVAVFGSVALQGAHGDLLRGLERTSDEVAALGDLWVLPPGEANLLVTTPFPVPSLGPVRGIERIDVYRGGFLDIGSRRLRVFGPPSDGPVPFTQQQLIEGDVEKTAARLRDGGWIVLSQGVARDLGLRVGDRFDLRSPIPTSLRVAAISTNMGWPPGALVLNADDYARAWGNDDASALVAHLSPGTSLSAGRRALHAALGKKSALTIATGEQRTHQQSVAAKAGVARLAQIAALVLAAAVLAMAATMAGMIWQRRSFMASMKIEGYSSEQLWRALMLEASVLIGAGCLVGAAFGLLGQGLLSRALTSVTGFPVVYVPAIAGALLTCAVVTASAVTIVALFGSRAAAIEPGYSLAD